MSPEGTPSARLRLLPHQVEAVQFALARRRAYLALAPGLGKTAVAATAARLLHRMNGSVTVYFSPPFLVRNVENELARWAAGLRVKVYGRLALPEIQALDVLIVPDSLIVRPDLYLQLAAFTRGRDALAIVDEAHRYKTARAKRTKALLGQRGRGGLVDLFTRRYLMSGTPMPNRPLELFPVLSREAPETIDWMNEWQFGVHFCDGHQGRWGWDFSGASNLPELREATQGGRWPYMLRMRKDLLDLPPKIEETFIVSADMSPTLAKLDREVSRLVGTGPDRIRAALAAQAGKGSARELHVASYRRLLGQEKIKPAAEYLNALLEDGDESILVGVHHKEVAKGLADALEKWAPIVITGDTPKMKRQALVDIFQRSPERRIAIGNLGAMGVGFTMTKATRVVLVEYSWVPGENEQFGDRTHRIGQTKGVLVQYMVYRNSVDRDVMDAVLEKSESIKQL